MIDVSRETKEKLDLYTELLLQWNQKMNLIAPSTANDIWERHILDSLQLCEYLPKGTKNIIDVGSGAGFPGIILAIATGAHVDLIESNVKKTIFLQEVIARLKLDAKTHAKRIEEIEPWESDVITARALADVDKLCTLLEKFMPKTQFCLFLKGQNVVEEIKDATRSWDFQSESFPSQTHKEGVILKVSQVTRR